MAAALICGVTRLAFAAVAPAATRLGAVTRGDSTLNMAVKKPGKKVSLYPKRRQPAGRAPSFVRCLEVCRVNS